MNADPNIDSMSRLRRTSKPDNGPEPNIRSARYFETEVGRRPCSKRDNFTFRPQEDERE